jgi:hypothetical protein
LSPKAFALLALLIDAAPRVVSKKELHERLWPGGAVSDATLVALVKQLRRALGDREREKPIIRTVHRIGYAFEGALRPAEEEHAGGAQEAGQCKIAGWLVGAGGGRMMLKEGENVVGRAPECDVHLDHLSVSRRHARIVVGARDVLVEDAGSKNGTSVGGERLVYPRRLGDGDEVSFGLVTLTFRASRAGPPTETHVGSPGLPREREQKGEMTR